MPDDDRQFLVDLGLVRRDPQGGLVVANPIYREVIPRTLTGGTQDSLPLIAPTWLTADGELDCNRLLSAFLAFWRQHGEPLLRSAAYHEIAPHIVLMAFLHRVVNGGGTLDREYAIGSDRMDICLRYGKTTLGIELKVWRDRRSDPLSNFHPCFIGREGSVLNLRNAILIVNHVANQSDATPLAIRSRSR